MSNIFEDEALCGAKRAYAQPVWCPICCSWTQFTDPLCQKGCFLAAVVLKRVRAASGIFEDQGDIEEAMRCAEAIGDDRIQKHSQGHVQPDLFTHGTSAQRKRWFMRGFRSGRIGDGNTFNVPYEDL